MAKSSSLLYYVVLLSFLPILAISSSHEYHHHHHKHHDHIKSMHFTLYQHDYFNQTDFLIVPGVVVEANFTATAAPFGTITVLRDKLTLTPDPSSKVLGDVEAITVASSFDGLDTLSVIRIALDLEDGHSGTISVVGVVNVLKPSDVPVTGGTGDFLLVQGYISSSILSMEGMTFVYKVDFHLFWPPYAPHRAMN